MYCRIVDLCDIHQVPSVAMVEILPQASLQLHIIGYIGWDFQLYKGKVSAKEDAEARTEKLT